MGGRAARGRRRPAGGLSERGSGSRAEFAYHRWVRRACLRAAVGGLVGLAVLLLVAGAAQGPGGMSLGPAAATAGLYAILFLATLAKIVHATRRPLAVLEPEALVLRPPVAFSPRRLPWRAVRAVAPRTGTLALEIEVENGAVDNGVAGAARVTVNLALLADRPGFLHHLGRRLEEAGLEPDPERPDGWCVPERRRRV